MAENVYQYPIVAGDAWPTICCKVLKGNDKFLYSVSLWVIYEKERREIVCIDNYHEEGHNIQGSHIHKRYVAEEKIEPFEFISISKTEDYIRNNWEHFYDKYKRKIIGGN